MSRKSARNLLFNLVFELCFHKPEESSSYEEFVQENDLSSENLAFVTTMYEGIVEHLNELTVLIEKHIKGYTLERLFKVDLAILLLAFYELAFYKQTPQNIVINEAVELAKKYSTDKSYSFINAVLGSFVATLKE